MTIPPPLSQDELATFFPSKRNPIAPECFELGLVLGGTVSAGAYTAGVLDYLIEALDAWQRAKEDGAADAPPHKVVISTMGGASGGAVNGAIVMRAAGWAFPHGADPKNPLYAAWATGVDLTRLLAADPSETALTSIFNCNPIDAQARRSVAYTGGPLGDTVSSPRHRTYLADPLRLIAAVGNITGVPYSISLDGESGLSHGLIAHADRIRFAMTVDNGTPNPPGSRPDEFALSPASPINWDRLRDAALATSAFPLAFRSRALSRGLAVAGYNAIAVPSEEGPAKIVQLVPEWGLLSGSNPTLASMTFANVDGGTINNEPLDIVRTALAGLDGRNSRKPAEADRAVILIDPFSDPETLGPSAPPGLTSVILPFVMSLVYQARFKPADIALANDENTYSRYLVAPVGPGPGPVDSRLFGSKAIASGGLGGFLGFLDPAFARHDFDLGRYNAHWFLRRHLCIPEEANNPLFARWTDAQKNTQRYETADLKRYLPIIPLMPGLRDHPPALPKWPRLAAMPKGLADAITARLSALYGLATTGSGSGIGKALATSYLWLGWRMYVRGALRDKALQVIEEGLKKQGLLDG